MEKHIGHAIIRTANVLRRCTMHDVTHSPGSTAVQNFFLGYLYKSARQGRQLYQRDLEREFSLRRSTASGILAGMEQNGLITRVPCEHDARMKTISLTDKAISQCRAQEEKIDAFERNLVRNFTPQECDQLQSLLERVCENAQILTKGKEGNEEC